MLTKVAEQITTRHNQLEVVLYGSFHELIHCKVAYWLNVPIIMYEEKVVYPDPGWIKDILIVIAPATFALACLAFSAILYLLYPPTLISTIALFLQMAWAGLQLPLCEQDFIDAWELITQKEALENQEPLID